MYPIIVMEIITRKYTIKQIFKEHWPECLNKHQKGIPDYVIENVEKILNCRNSARLDYHKYVCLKNCFCYIIQITKSKFFLLFSNQHCQIYFDTTNLL